MPGFLFDLYIPSQHVNAVLFLLFYLDLFLISDKINSWFGGDSKMETPVPIPNTEVKHLYADGSKFNLARVGSCQAFSLIYILFLPS